MNGTVTHLLPALFAASFVGGVGWLSGFSVELTVAVSVVVALAAFVPLWLAWWARRRGRTQGS